MAIATYAELQDAVTVWLNKPDAEQNVATFIALAEADINRRLRHHKMTKRSVAEIDSQFSVTPTDFLETIRFQITDGTPTELELMAQAEIVDRREEIADVTGRPRFYAITGSQFEFLPSPDDTYNAELVYFGKIPTLGTETPTNWLLTDHPDLYLYGALVHSAPYLGDDARMQVWATLYQSALDSANLASDRSRHSGSGLRMKIRSY